MKNQLNSKKSIVAIVIAVVVLAYLIFPFDILPDVAVGVGQIDDVVVALLGIALEVITVISGGKGQPKGKHSQDETTYEEAKYREVDE